MNNQALRPTNYKEFSTLGKEEDQDEESKGLLEDEQKALAYIGNLKGWKILKEYIERIESDLDSMITSSVANGSSYEEIGRKTAVREVVKNVTRRIIGKVEDCRK